MDQPLVEPEARRSANGVLSTSLRCAYAYRDIGGMRLYLRSYEGGLAPTLRMKPGETLKIRLINDLPPNRDRRPANPSFPHQINNTNFHFHGAHCSPSGIADNVMRSMVPGKSYDIEIACRPTTRAAPTGTIRITTARPTCRWRAAWRAPSSSKATSPTCPRSPRRASASCCCRRSCSMPSTWSRTSARSFRKPRRASWRSTASGGRPSTCGRARCSAGAWSARSTRTTCCWNSTSIG